MATINGHDHRTLKQQLFQQYGDFNVFQLMRLLLSQFATTLPIEQRLRFKADLSSAFPAREFSRLSVRNDGQKTNDSENLEEVIEISSANFCIASVLGPLPESFTEWVRDLVAERVPAMADFLDIFNQRINLLRFELKQAQTLALNSLAPGETRVAQDLAALMGLGTAQLAEQVPLPRRAWLGLAGLLANRRKNAATVVHVLNLVLQAKVTLTPFIGGWQTIEAQDTTRLGSRNQRLGQTSVLGQRVWDQHARIRLEIETLDYNSACQLLPPNQSERAALAKNPSASESNFSRFSALLLLLLDGLVDCEVVIRVDESSIPPAQLTQPRGVPHELAAPLRLGQTAWLQRRTSTNAVPRVVRYLLCADESMRAA